MPKNLKPSDKVNGYTITSVLNKGGMAISYAATDRTGRKVFFKQYKSPTVTVDWYKGYVGHVKELKQRIQNNSAKQFCYEIIDVFEADAGCRCLFQVFEFVDQAQDLEKCLSRIAARSSSVSWEQRILMAKQFMASIKAIHEASIVHCDLKPANILLYEDRTIAAKYQAKLIDMDFSILADKNPPWHGKIGYVGTHSYMSPEHLTDKSKPVRESDIFTCGIILLELLTNEGHPYRMDHEEYKRTVLAGKRPPRMTLAGPLPGKVPESLVACLSAALDPKPANRPSAKDILDILNGRKEWVPGRTTAPPPPPPTRAPTRPMPISSHASAPAKAGSLTLTGESGEFLRFNIAGEVGRRICSKLGDDSRFLSEVQFVLDKDGSGAWSIRPNPEATNETLLNGKAIISKTKLENGDEIAVGREAKGIKKLPLTVSFT